MEIKKQEITVTSYFSEDSLHRFGIRRVYNNLNEKKVCFIMINPSYANERLVDKTNMIANNIGIKEGYGEIIVLNMYSKISSSLEKFKYNCSSANLEENDDFIIKECVNTEKIILVWGIDSKYEERRKKILSLIQKNKLCEKLYAIKYTDSNNKIYFPAHLSRYISDNKQNFSLKKINCNYIEKSARR